RVDRFLRMPLAPNPHRIGHAHFRYSYHNYSENNINGYRLKTCIFVKIGDLWIKETTEPDFKKSR
ncbi:MAG: hypothetical protein KJ814_02070, partial [Proteobacteria bacterium]|nr:hypothetical protein [Pseudomonadota bacterium]